MAFFYHETSVVGVLHRPIPTIIKLFTWADDVSLDLDGKLDLSP